MDTIPVHPVVFVPVVVAGWLFVCLVMARASGWQRLAERYASDAPVEGRRFRMRSAIIGSHLFPVNYGGCLFATVGERALALSVLFTFRPGHPRLVLPWSAIEGCEPTRHLFRPVVAVQVAGHPKRLLLAGSLGEAVMRQWERSVGPGASPAR